MRAATGSIVPWFVHKRMLPKWAGFLISGAIALASGITGHWIALVAGVLAFFPSEYLVHRFVFHHLQDAKPGNFLSFEHIAHHEEPTDVDHIFNYPLMSVGIGVIYFGVAYLVTRDLGTAGAFSWGNFIGLVYYEWVHFAAHRPGAVPWTPWGRALKRMHLWHHFKNEHYWFGVTNRVFDHALGTHRDPEDVGKSATVRTLVPSEEERKILES